MVSRSKGSKPVSTMVAGVSLGMGGLLGGWGRGAGAWRAIVGATWAGGEGRDGGQSGFARSPCRRAHLAVAPWRFPPIA